MNSMRELGGDLAGFGVNFGARGAGACLDFLWYGLRGCVGQ